jgi:hypothetical protein
MNIYFWDKPATIPEKEDKDKPNFNVVEEDQSIREVVRNIENKIIGTKRTFSETKPDNPSVKKWIRKILEDYPNKNDEIVDDILNEFRSVLRTRSKEKEKIVGILQLNDTLVIVHCKKDPSLAEIEDKLYSVKTVLHPKNIIRADIIKNEDGTLTLFAFESSRKWSKGHAKFWGIEPEDVGWESIGSITLNIELVKFRLPVQIPIEVEQLKELIDNGDISVTGKIRIGQEEGKITKVFVYGKAMTYSHFYDFFVTGTEKIENYKKKFRDIIPPQQQISAFDKEVRYRYEEDKNKLYEITTSGSNQICKKEHLRFTICFFTKERPGIKPMMQGYLWDLYQSVFENKKLEIWHAGEESTLEPLKIGSLEIYNQIEVPDDISVFSNNLLNQLQDAQSKKTKLLLQYFFCKLYSQNIKSKHFNFLFDFFIEELISKEIEFEFKNEGLLEKENLLEFKSVDDIKGKPTRFAKDRLVPTVRKYLDAGNLKRYCILYGVEDNGAIKPIVHLKSDQITEIENLANKELSKDKATVCLQQIPFKEGLILAVFLIPQIKGYVSDYESTN